jgi:hypothetical protein
LFRIKNIVAQVAAGILLCPSFGLTTRNEGSNMGFTKDDTKSSGSCGLRQSAGLKGVATPDGQDAGGPQLYRAATVQSRF